ncbi:MAG: hypothetical protein R2712_07185 [Vicinamibacterales bacterium]
MRLAELLRLTAIGIALLCWLDPPVVVAPRPPVPVDVALIPSDQDARPLETGSPETVAARIEQVGRELTDRLGADAEVRVSAPPRVRRLPCEAQRPCVVVAGPRGESRCLRIERDRRSLVRVGGHLSPNVWVTGLEVPDAHTAAAGEAQVALHGTGMLGTRTRVRLLDGAAVVGEASHDWTTDGAADVTVPWWPVAPGVRTLVARASTDGTDEASDLDNIVEGPAAVTDERWPVVVVERRPSWAATFARRALQADRRLEVEARTDVAPGVSARSAAGGAVLDDARLDRARVVVVGAPDALGAEDVARLDAFVRRRGGALLLAPDRALTGPVQRLLVHGWREHISADTARAGALEGREWLVAGDLTPFDVVLARGEMGVVAAAAPVERGYVGVVGGLDAWRRREDGGGFDRFWQDTVARLANVTAAPMTVSATPREVSPGDDVTVRVAARSVRPLAALAARATMACGGQETVVIRLWPDHAADAFVGRGRVPQHDGTCVVAGAVSGIGEGTAEVAVRAGTNVVTGGADADLEALVTRTGGVVATDADLAPVVSGLMALASDLRTPEPRYPMRSAWWLLPFAGSLAGEWWLRRRAGLR